MFASILVVLGLLLFVGILLCVCVCVYLHVCATRRLGAAAAVSRARWLPGGGLCVCVVVEVASAGVAVRLPGPVCVEGRGAAGGRGQRHLGRLQLTQVSVDGGLTAHRWRDRLRERERERERDTFELIHHIHCFFSPHFPCIALHSTVNLLHKFVSVCVCVCVCVCV